MLKQIESIRKKPKEVRNRYAFWSAFLITAVIASFWLASVPARLAVLTNTTAPETVKVQGGFSRVFSSLKASVLDGLRTPVQTQQESPSVEQPDSDSEELIDFTTFFSTSSERIEKKEAPQGKQVLIGTSSNRKASSTGEEL